MTRAAAIAVALLAACTSTQPEPTVGSTAVPSASPSPSPSIGVLPLIAVEGAPALDGMRLAAEQVGITLDVSDPSGDPAGAVRRVLSSKPAAILVVDQPAAIEAARPEIEAARVPVVLVGGDLYSDRALFRYAFQVSTPLTWQARVLAHYLASDRGDEQVAVAGERRISQAALAGEGLPPVEDLADSEALLALRPGPPTTDIPEDLQLALGADALAFSTALPAGTVASAPYTWAGWADPIPRVAKFRERFSARFGHEPGLAEQEGYDAVRAVVEALDRTGGSGGDVLIRELESFRDETFSSTPIRLGPDDHVFAEQSHLGLFAVAGPGEEPTPPEAMGALPWRPVMRTFTTNGKRVNLADRDVRVFFPNWGPRRPRPNYWRSEYGIVTRPDDPLH
jgi:Periplasmic binding protein